MIFWPKNIRILVSTSALFIWSLFSGTSFSKTSALSASSTINKDIGFSFAAPAGWRIEAASDYNYLLKRRGIEPGYPITLTTEHGSNVKQGQSARIKKVYSVFPGPHRPLIIEQSQLRSKSGVRILKADMRWIAKPNRGSPYRTRTLLYSFRAANNGQVHTLICSPLAGSLPEKLLDELAMSISF